MRRAAVIGAAVVALACAGIAQAQSQTLWPGVSYETGVQFTPNGPVAINILTGPRPGGATTLDHFPDWLDWPARTLAFRTQFGTDGPLVDATRVGAAPRSGCRLAASPSWFV